LKKKLLLTAKNLSFGYEYPLFENISFNLFEGDILRIDGVSGSGKSTLLNILSTLIKPQSGSLNILDRDVVNISQNELERLRRDDIGIIFQSHHLFRGFTVEENLKVVELSSKNSKFDINLMKSLGVDKLLKKQIGSLSGGEQQRVSILRVLFKQPKIILADEPISSLDLDNSKKVLTTLHNYVKSSGAGVILISH
jgi:putative ABC transport system ATP-binding protein